jgi:hypothetical protein
MSGENPRERVRAPLLRFGYGGEGDHGDGSTCSSSTARTFAGAPRQFGANLSRDGIRTEGLTGS